MAAAARVSNQQGHSVARTLLSFVFGAAAAIRRASLLIHGE